MLLLPQLWQRLVTLEALTRFTPAIEMVAAGKLCCHSLADKCIRTENTGLQIAVDTRQKACCEALYGYISLNKLRKLFDP